MAKTAEQYLATLPAAEQQQVRASLASSGSTADQWYQAAIDAGDPRAIVAAGGQAGATEAGWEAAGGAVADPSGAADASTWMGKRAPTPRELRKWAQGQHAAYVAGDRSAQDEDYERYTDRQLATWIAEGWDPAAGGWKAGWNAAGKASDMQPPGGGGGGGGGRVVAAPAVNPATGLLESKAPADPRTAELADLQNVLEEKFMARQGQFGVGAGGANLPDTFAKPLGGGGIWWGADKGMFDAATSGGAAAPVAVPVASAPARAPAPATAPFDSPATPAPQTSIPTPQNMQTMVGGPLEEELRRKRMTKQDFGGMFRESQYGI